LCLVVTYHIAVRYVNINSTPDAPVKKQDMKNGIAEAIIPLDLQICSQFAL